MYLYTKLQNLKKPIRVAFVGCGKFVSMFLAQYNQLNKIILALTSVGLLILLIFPASLSASHFRYGTMSWEEPWDNRTIRLNMEIGWTVPHTWGGIPTTVGGINTASNSKIKIFWGDGTSDVVTYKVTAIDTNTNDAVSEMGDNSTGTWIAGALHTYPDNGTTEYVVYWGSSARRPAENYPATNVQWRNETKVTIGGPYAGNVSPVSAVPPVVQVQDNSTFTYQVSATDANGDNLTYRWGTKAEFYSGVASDGVWTDASGSYYKPFGMTLSTSGLVTWDVSDSVVDNGTLNSLWVAVMMVEDLDSSSGDNKSYIPIDFFFKIASASNDPPAFTKFPTGTRTVSVGTTKTIKIKSTDDSGVAPTISVLNPPSDNSSIWDNTTSTAGGTTTFTINFTPDSSMGDTSYAVNIRSTDNAGMTKDQSLSIQVSSVANADPTAPILISPANGDNVTSPVTFRFAGSTDSDGDNVSYTMYICDDSGFVGSGLCAGTSVTAGGNFVPPFNQNFHDNLIPWPSPLYASTISQQISQDLSMIPKWFIMLVMLGLLSVIISLSVKNITHRRIVFVLFWLIIGMVSCSTSSSNEDGIGGGTEESEESEGDTDTTAPILSEVTAVTTPSTDSTPNYTFS